MNLNGRRQSNNVEDRRGMSTGRKAGLGVGGLLIAGIIYLVSGGRVDVSQLVSTQTTTPTQQTEYVESELESELRVFASQILAGTEDVWAAEFKKMGRTYKAPKLVIFKDAVQSGCGGATSSSGPFYCSADQCVYLDLDFFASMKQQLGADGDFAYAYVIAHEVGHHVQYLLGTLNDAHQQMARYGQDTPEANKISVRLELQADFYAGIWAYHDNEMFGSLEEGDIEEGMNVASKIGDDYLQKKAYGRTVPDAFNHGTSAQRSRWLKKGLTTGNIKDGDTFTPSYRSL